jgi:hypothetical protein
MERLASVLVIILVAGLLGGLGAYLVDPVSGRKLRADRANALIRYFILGIIAAAVMPLFLSLVRSGLMKEIFVGDSRTTLDELPLESLLVFAGLCLIAAFSARRFIDSVSRQILQRVDRIDQKTDQLDARTSDIAKRAHSAEEMALGALELVDEREARSDKTKAAMAASLPAGVEVPGVSDDERRALASMLNTSFRTATGIARDSGISRNQIGDLLDGLVANGLAVRTVSPTTHGTRWRVTPLGVAAAKAREA